jgi:hypothetical protein
MLPDQFLQFRFPVQGKLPSSSIRCRNSTRQCYEV